MNISTHFPEGAIFRLTQSNVEVQTLGEVRYCLPGIGIGVELVGMDPKDVRAIEKECKSFFPSSSRQSSVIPGEASNFQNCNADLCCAQIL